MTLGRVTVLLFIIGAVAGVRADDVTGTHINLFKFTSEFYMPMGNGRIDGLMASDSSRQRIAIYWIEPTVYHDHSYFISYSDFIFTRQSVHFWTHGASHPVRVHP